MRESVKHVQGGDMRKFEFCLQKIAVLQRPPESRAQLDLPFAILDDAVCHEQVEQQAQPSTIGADPPREIIRRAPTALAESLDQPQLKGRRQGPGVHGVSQEGVDAQILHLRAPTMPGHVRACKRISCTRYSLCALLSCRSSGSIHQKIP